MTQQEQ